MITSQESKIFIMNIYNGISVLDIEFDNDD